MQRLDDRDAYFWEAFDLVMGASTFEGPSAPACELCAVAAKLGANEPLISSVATVTIVNKLDFRIAISPGLSRCCEI